MTEPLLSATEGFITLHVFFRFSATQMFQRNWARRAALGVSIVSDSLTVVVSEETGVISYAEGGKLVRYVDKKTLAELLEGVFAAPEQEKTFASLFKRLTKDETKQKK